jgi:hypothetical protein
VSSRTLVASAVVAVLAAAPAWAQQGPAAAGATARPWRVLGGASLAGSAFDTAYVSRYAPPLAGVPHESSATETLPLDATTGHGLQIGVERTLGAHVGVQLLGEYAESDITGEPGQYDVRIVYTSRPPPSNEPVTVEARRSEARPEAAGRMKTWLAAVNLSAWWDAGPKARVGISAGPAWLRSEGEAESLVVPWSAIIFDSYGGTWIYESLGEQRYARRRVEVKYVADSTAVLSRGPAVGAQIVTVGTAELFGTEFFVSK